MAKKSKIAPIISAPGLKPIGMRLVVKKFEVARNAGKLAMPSIDKLKDTPPVRALVKTVGAGLRDNAGILHPMALSEGDTVLVNGKAGVPIVLNGEELTILQYVDIYGVIEKKTA